MKKVIIVILLAVTFSSCQERSEADLKTIEHFHQINIEDRKQGFMRDTSYAEAVREWEIGKDNSSRDYHVSSGNSSRAPIVMPVPIVITSHK